MASGWNSGSDREAMLRRVAIVLSSLPAPVASRLLGSIAPDQKQAIRRTMSTLTDVDPLERQRAIQAFKVMLQHPSPSDASSSSQADRMPIDRERHGEPRSPASRSTPRSDTVSESLEPEVTSPLSFLRDVEERELAQLLSAEHPQTIAFVLASIEPEQAARVLPHLGSDLRQETISRIGRLGEIPETAVAEVAEHFRGRLGEQGASRQQTLGRRALDAILAAMPKQETSVSGFPQEPVASSSRNGRGDLAGRDRDAGAPTTSEFQRTSFPATDRPALDLSQRLKVAEETWPETWQNEERFEAGERGRRSAHPADARVASPSPSPSPRSSEDSLRSHANKRPGPEGTSLEGGNDGGHEADTFVASPHRDLFSSTDKIHQHLVELAPIELCRALGKVETRDAMLALCGLPVHVTNAALAVLPRAQAKLVRTKMNSLGSLHLREIDLAKEKVAEASLNMLSSESSPLPVAA